MNAICSNTIFLSKVIRCKIAAKNKQLITGGGMRAHSFESAIKGSRAGYLVGADTGFPAFFRKYNIKKPPKISINAYHAVIKSFPSEIEAMRATAKLFPNRSRPMVDTYDFKKGIDNVIKVSKELKKKDQTINAITIDSGDLYKRSLYARKKFDQVGLNHIKIILCSNLDEWKINDLVKKKTPVDSFLAVTEIATVADDPKLEIVYKLTELCKKNKTKLCAKFAKGKLSYPGRKQVFRIYKNKKATKDIIGLENEKLGTPLLKKMISKGKITYNLPNLEKIREHIQKEIKSLPPRLLDIEKQHKYPVQISKKLQKLLAQAKKEHLN